MNKRKITKEIQVGGIKIGNGSPISIQSMTKTDTRDINATVDQIKILQDAGCDIIRVAVLNMEAAKAIKEIKKRITIPLVSDIHFDYRLALEVLDNGIDKLRINPGNIGDESRIKQVVLKAKERNVPIRIGVNGGSLEKDILEKYSHVTPEALVESASKHIRILENYDFDNIVVSMKSSNVGLSIDAYKLFSTKYDYPLHIGITESGTLRSGTVKSSMGLGVLLYEGIGDTMRVSLTSDPVNEVMTGQEILKTFNLLNKKKIEFVSCPTCGRCQVDLIRIAQEVEEACMGIQKNIKIAIMGCGVNGPGEAKDADLGIAGGKNKALLFKKGEIIATLDEKDIIKEVLKEIDRL